LNDPFRLTPAQIAFVKLQIPDFSAEKYTVELAGQAGSMRSFVRIKPKSGASAVLVIWDSKDEDWPRFLSIPEELRGSLSFLPEIYGSDPRHGLILEEDLGDMTLKRFGLEHAPTGLEDMYRKTLAAVCEWQNLGPYACGPTIAARRMDLETFLWETDYFARRCVVDFCGCEGVLDAEWEKERLQLAQRAAALPQTPLHRDFQSENIMITGGKIRFVDFQGARLGPPAYDVASLLFDPYVKALSEEMVARLFLFYTALPLRLKSGESDFMVCAAQRLMQALGAYGNLSIHKGKTRYREFVPVALERLCGVMKKLPEYEAINRVVDECSAKI
jgi:N-acetylmuramate 1-kinase